MHPDDANTSGLPNHAKSETNPPQLTDEGTEFSGLASFKRRAAAFLIDFAILSATMFAVERMLRPVFLAPEVQLWAMNYVLKAMSGSTQEKLAILGVLFGVLVALLIPYDLYFIFFEYAMGATPGKKACRIRVEALDETPLTLKQCWVRQIFRHLDFLLVVPAVGGIIYGGRKQRLGDWAAGTVVVDVLDLPPWEIPTRNPSASTPTTSTSTLKQIDEEGEQIP